ncbi:probable G-protein coupled receptor frpr-1 [Physella acuta]|uniref:probable G-protein coupled receptor frpr-1 n=1 Tax=Physella acuta TaxID=109671 RepID=UPI0027DBFABD|nr:probable G-protein coupled receptor frpr-1 [Physella acuta]
MAINTICFEAVSLAGICANLVNIMVFTKQGFKDTVNITLTALAVGDIGSLVTLQLFFIFINPWFLKLDVTFIPLDVVTMVSFYPHNYFIRVCGFITAFAAFERCLCVVTPLKVKQIITKNVVITFNISVFIVTFFNIFHVYYICYFDWKFSANVNKTLLTLSFRSNREAVFSVSYFITDLFVPYFTFAVIILSTAVIAVKLHIRARWRGDNITTQPNTDVTTKDKKLILMLTTVSVIFIVCLIPQSAILTAVSLVRGLSLKGSYFDLALLCYVISYYMETINSSVNFLVYYKMSSKFQKTLRDLFDRQAKVRTKLP